MAALGLTLHFVRREIGNRYLGSFSGGLWALFQPLILLAVYSVVFVYVFRQGAPPGSNVGYVPFLFMGLWPWTMFAESLSRATTVIQDNAALIGKVALPRDVLVFSVVAGSFIVQLAGFVLICVVLRVSGTAIDLAALPLAMLAFVQLFVFALGFAFLFAGIQVFVRDLAPALPQLLTVWMFASPILYARESLPAAAQHYLDFNPFAPYPQIFRSILVHTPPINLTSLAISMAVALAVFAIGYGAFRRVQSHFEDFL